MIQNQIHMEPDNSDDSDDDDDDDEHAMDLDSGTVLNISDLDFTENWKLSSEVSHILIRSWARLYLN